MYGEKEADLATQERLRELIELERQEIIKDDAYHIWNEWFHDVWLNPQGEELQRRIEEVDEFRLPFECNKVYGNV